MKISEPADLETDQGATERLVAMRFVTLQVNARTTLHALPDDGRALEDVTIGELRRAGWIEASMDLRRIMDVAGE